MDLSLFIKSLSDKEKKELSERLNLDFLNKTLIKEWVKNKKMSYRLSNLLHSVADYYLFIEDIEIDEIEKYRGWGKQTIKEFIELRGF